MKKDNYSLLIRMLKDYDLTVKLEGGILCAYKENYRVCFNIAGENFEGNPDLNTLHSDQLINSPEKITALILSKLKLNTTVYARSCAVIKLDKQTAQIFLEKYHLMNSTQSAFNFGLVYKDELISVASFSKGRKMNRLKENQRSFELIRFCSKSEITITGGLSKLLKTFCEEKKAGDVMTYVDKNLSDGASFIRAGFKKHNETQPNYFLVNRKTFERIAAVKDEKFDKKKFYLSKNEGNIKLVYTP